MMISKPGQGFKMTARLHPDGTYRIYRRDLRPLGVAGVGLGRRLEMVLESVPPSDVETSLRQELKRLEQEVALRALGESEEP